jgi:hypothetical protein
MADDIAAFKQLQAGLNANFEALYVAKDAKSVAAAKDGLTGLGYATAGAAMGPAFSIIALTGTVSGVISVIALNTDSSS